MKMKMIKNSKILSKICIIIYNQTYNNLIKMNNIINNKLLQLRCSLVTYHLQIGVTKIFYQIIIHIKKIKYI